MVRIMVRILFYPDDRYAMKLLISLGYLKYFKREIAEYVFKYSGYSSDRETALKGLIGIRLGRIL